MGMRLVPAVDLTATSDFTLALLDDTLAWRHRLTKELEFGAGDHLRVTSRYQVQFPSSLMGRFVPDDRVEIAKVLVPLTTRNKKMLLNFAVTGHDDEPAHRIARKSSAAIQGEYLRRLALTSAAGEGFRAAMRSRLLEAICVFMPDVVRNLAVPYPAWTQRLAAYLRSGLGFDVPEAAVRRWWEPARAAGTVLAEALGEPPDAYSSSEMVLLALPRMDPLPRTLDEIDDLVTGYHAGVMAARACGDTSFLMALADYGRRYELIVETRLPVREPATLTLAEDRELRLSAGGWTEQQVAFGDARSTHVEARTTDHTVEIDGFEVHDVSGRPVPSAWFEGVYWTSEALQLYSSEPGRPYYVKVRLRFRSDRNIVLTGLALAVITLLSTVLAAVAQRDVTAVLALVTVPTTLAATLALIREQTALAGRVLVPLRVLIEVSIGALWAVVLTRTAFAAITGDWIY